MQEITLKARVREGEGTKAAHRLRASGEVPAVLYGHKKEAVSLAVPSMELWHILHSATSEHIILTLDIEGGDGEGTMTLIREVQHHPVSGEILHVDFQRIAFGEKIKVGVPLNLVGIAIGVKEFGGILDHGVREVNVRTVPRAIPEAIDVDVSELMIGQSVHVGDIVADWGDLEFLDDHSVTLAHVSPPKKLELTAEEEAAAEAEEAAAAGEAGEEGASEESDGEE